MSNYINACYCHRCGKKLPLYKSENDNKIFSKCSCGYFNVIENVDEFLLPNIGNREDRKERLKQMLNDLEVINGKF